MIVLRRNTYCTGCVFASARTGRFQGGCHGVSRAPPYLSQLTRISELPGRGRLCSSSSQLLQVAPLRRSFPAAAHVLWNSLPLDIQSFPFYLFSANGCRHFLFCKSFPIFCYDIFSQSTRFRGLCDSFWATVCKTVRPMLSDHCPILCVLSVTLVYCGQND